MELIGLMSSSKEGAAMSAGTLFRNTRLFDVENRAIRAVDVLVSEGRIERHLFAGAACDADREVDLDGALVIPGFMDAHLHIESSMLSVAEFARAAVACGTAAVFVDPHEIANVAGVPGVRYFLDQADALPIELFVGVPSCVPATHLENAGGQLGLDEITALLAEPRVYGLAEMMNFPGIIHGLGDARAKVDAALDAGKLVDGHAPGVTGSDLDAYVSNGRNDGVVRIGNDHECSNQDEAVEKHAKGMTIAIRCGTASKDIDRILPGLFQRMGGNLDRFMLCSDDVSAYELLTEGHVDRIVRRARDIFLADGLAPERAALEAVRLATLNVARYYESFLTTRGLGRAGTLSPGAPATFLVLDSLESLHVRSVYRNGEKQAPTALDGEPPLEGGSPLEPLPSPPELRSSVKLPTPPSVADFAIPVPAGTGGAIDTRVIGVQRNSLLTDGLTVRLPVTNGRIAADPARDIAKMAVFERHGGPGTHTVGLVQGLGLRVGAVASTVAHDSHNLVLAGVNDDDLVAAANALVDSGGGLAVSVGGHVETLPLPIGGLMSDERIHSVAEKLKTLVANAAERTGCHLENPFMALSFLSLPVIPALKITDRGLVDVTSFDFTALFR